MLAERLKAKFKYSTVPPLPPPFSAFSTVTESLETQRLVGLQLFVSSMIRHPFLSATVATEIFLEPTETISKEALDESLKKKGIGYLLWVDYLTIVETPPDIQLLLKEIHHEIRSLNDFYASFLKEMDVLNAKLNNYASTLKNFNLSFETWRNVERADLHKLSALVATESTEVPKVMVASFLQQVEGANEANRSRVHEKAEKTLEIMKDPIRYEKLVIESLSHDVNKVQSAVSAYEKAVKAVENLKAEK